MNEQILKLANGHVEARKRVLEHWKTVREHAIEAHAQFEKHHPDIEHQLPDLVAACDIAIAELHQTISELQNLA